MKPNIIAISSSPGTGKTSTSTIIAKELGANLISISTLIKKHKIRYKLDKERDTKILRISDLKKAVKKSVDRTKINIIDGHLSHLLNPKATFVLICNPNVLRKRLLKRKWPLKKIDENVLAEMLDIILAEADKPYKIDTTKLTAKQTASKILKLIKNPELYKEKKHDWLQNYKELVIGMKHN